MHFHLIVTNIQSNIPFSMLMYILVKYIIFCNKYSIGKKNVFGQLQSFLYCLQFQNIFQCGFTSAHSMESVKLYFISYIDSGDFVVLVLLN